MSLAVAQTSAIKEVLEQVLATVSPDEVMLVEDSVSVEHSDRDFDGMLGFGTGSEILLVLPILLEGFKELASTASVEIAKKWGQNLADWINKGGALHTSSFQAFADTLRGRLEKRGFPPDKACQIADCVVATLASRPDLVASLVKRK